MLEEEQRSTTRNGITWWKAKASSGNGNCVEFAVLGTDAIGVRDSKNPDGPIHRYTMAEWDAFVLGVKNDEFVVSSR